MTITPKSKETSSSTNLSEYIYCEIKFGTEIAVWDKAPGYHYISKFENIQPDDVVVVPTSWGEKLGVVKTVIRCTEADAPWPVSKTKHILRIAREMEIWAGVVLEDPSAAEPSAESYLEQKRRLIALIQRLQCNSHLDDGLDLSKFIPEFAESIDSLSGGTYYEQENLFILRTRVYARNSSSELIKPAEIGQELSCRVEESLFIVISAGAAIGRLSPEVGAVILPLIRSGNATIETVAVSHIDPLYVDISIRLSGVEEEGCRFVIEGYYEDGQVCEKQILSTTIPVSAAQTMYQLWELYCDSDLRKSFSDFWKAELGNDPGRQEAVEPYLEGWKPNEVFVSSIYDLFLQFAVDEKREYWLDGKAIGYDVWMALLSQEFYYRDESIVLIDPTVEMEVHRVDFW